MAQYPAGPLPQEYPRKPPALWTDLLMLALAVVSVALVTWITFFTVPQHTYRVIVVIDVSICAVFAVEFPCAGGKRTGRGPSRSCTGTRSWA